MMTMNFIIPYELNGVKSFDIEAHINPQKILADLGYTKISELKRIYGGWATLLWRFKTEDGSYHTLRIYHKPQKFKEDMAEREELVLKICHKAGLPVPAVEKSAKINELPVLVLSWCEGLPLLSFIEKKPWQVWHWGRVFGELQAKLHKIKPPAELIKKTSIDWISRITGEYKKIASYILTLNPSSDSIIHLDFHPLNIISDGSKITGIIDFSGACLGDIRADLARTEVTILTAPIPPSPIHAILDFARRIFLKAWRYGYTKTAGAIPNYHPFIGWACGNILWEIELFGAEFNMVKKEEIKTLSNTLQELIDVWIKKYMNEPGG
jgi:aminoglycoside phosphotransferase (APT) family kinase protein